MSSLRQIEANRLNALKSTGPTSVAGKAASSMNALKSGIHAKSTIIPCEKAADLQQLIDEYYAYYQPGSPAARDVLDDLIRTAWTLRRLDTSEASLWHYQHDDSFRPVPKEHRQGKVVSQNMKTFAALQRRLDSTRRGRDRALAAFKQLQSEPAPVPEPTPAAATPSPEAASTQIGFVPSSLPDSPANPVPEPSTPQRPAPVCGIPIQKR